LREQNRKGTIFTSWGKLAGGRSEREPWFSRQRKNGEAKRNPPHTTKFMTYGRVVSLGVTAHVVSLAIWLEVSG